MLYFGLRSFEGMNDVRNTAYLFYFSTSDRFDG